MKKNKIKPRRKRVKLSSLILKNTAVAVMLTVFLSAILFNLGQKSAFDDVEAQISSNTADMVWRLNDKVSRNDSADKISSVLYTNSYFVPTNIDTPLDIWHMVGSMSPNCYAATALFDKDGNIIKDNRLSLIMIYDHEMYLSPVKDNPLPQMKKLYAEYKAMSDISEKIDTKPFAQPVDSETYAVINIKKAYFNKDKHFLFPKDLEIQIMQSGATDKILDSKPLHIDYDGDCEIVDFSEDKILYGEFFGVDDEVADMLESECKSATENNKDFYGYTGGVEHNGFAAHTYRCLTPAYYKGEKMALYSIYHIDLINPKTAAYFGIEVLVVFVMFMIIALAAAFVRNAKNQAEYIFEDYQRTLTNNLAHDLKTPLAAISGYAENLVESEQDEKRLKYLGNIMTDVKKTDEIISHMLKLNALNGSTAERTKFSAAEAVKAAAAHCNTDIKLTGDRSLYADRAAFDAVVQNLIANAVKYTSDSGSITADIDKKCLTITNAVHEDIDTTQLLKPFVKGDSARTDRTGSGIGLAIANDAAAINNYTLEISCKNKVFTAKVKF